MKFKEAVQVILEMGLNTLKYRLKLVERHRDLFNHFDSIGDYSSKLNTEFSLISNYKRTKKIVLAITSFVDSFDPAYFDSNNLKEFKETDWLGWYQKALLNRKQTERITKLN